MISLCIPNWKRIEMVVEAFQDLLDDDRVSEIVISDDASDNRCHNFLKIYFEDTPKVKLFQNDKRLGVYENKKMAVEHATNDWVIIGDSDNIFGKDYIDKVSDYANPEKPMCDPRVVIAPSFAKPAFGYREYQGKLFAKDNVAQYVDKPLFNCLLNTMNYFVNRNEYLRIWKPHANMKTADSIYMNYLWLSAGNMIFVQRGLEYLHRIHDSGYYNAAVGEPGQLTTTEVEQMIKQLS